MPIDTLKAAKRLKELGFDEEQSEGVAELLSDLDVASATKEDLDETEGRLKEHVEHRLSAAEERIKRELSNRIYAAAGVVAAVLTLVNYLVG